MTAITVSDLRKDIYNILKSVIKTHEPVTIISRNAEESAVLVSQSDWEDIQETLFLQSNKDAREAILEAMQEPIDEGVDIDWRSGK